jgi:protein-tyrosine phosphatase
MSWVGQWFGDKNKHKRELMNGKISVLFVCMGNICRSPTAHGMFLDLVEKQGLTNILYVDSAGTHAYHVAEPPDPRAQETARKRGIDLSGLRARKAIEGDFEIFDYILAMDQSNYEHLSKICPQGCEQKLKLFLEFAPHLDINEVPDPYYGGPSGFERVFDAVEEASHGLLDYLRQQHGF